MAYCELTQPLLQATDDSYDEPSYDGHIEDSSSGYDSSDVSDSESDWPLKSRVNCLPANHREDEEVSARMKSTNALCESLKLILDMPEMCDVTFLVGSREVPVHGVRAILGTRSKVFYQLLIKHLNQREETLKSSKPYSRPYGHRLTIPVKKYDAEVFRMLIQFVHCGSVTITDRTVAGLLCGADQFQLRDLEQACWKYIDRRVELGCGTMIINSARAYSHHRKATEIRNDVYAMMDASRVETSSKTSSNESTV